VVLNSGRVGDTPVVSDEVLESEEADLGETAAGFTHFRAWDAGTKPRRSFNNIFFAAYSPELTMSKPIAFLPHHEFVGRSNANSYFRIGPENVDVFLVADAHDPLDDHITTYPSREGYREEHPTNEADSDELDPMFRSINGVTAQPSPEDDLRLRAGSPGLGAAKPLPWSLFFVDLRVGGILSLLLRDRGCYGSRWFRLRVGVDGRMTFPT
jgi:hypothetical protein